MTAAKSGDGKCCDAPASLLLALHIVSYPSKRAGVVVVVVSRFVCPAANAIFLYFLFFIFNLQTVNEKSLILNILTFKSTTITFATTTASTFALCTR